MADLTEFDGSSRSGALAVDDDPRGSHGRWLWLLPITAIAVLAGLIVMYPMSGQSDEGASEAEVRQRLPVDVGIDPRLDQSIPLDVVFRDERGEPATLGSFISDKPVVLNLVYFRCPMLCNMVVDGFIRTLRTMKFDVGQEFTVLTVSFDAREGPELAAEAKRTALRRYGRSGAEASWHFLTGTESSIRQLADAVGFRFLYDEQRAQYAHAAGLFVLTPTGRLSRFLSGVQFPSRDLRLALVEASANKIGSATDHVLLLCYRYDPTKGKYGLLIMRIIRMTSLLTVALMVVGFVALLRRGPRHPVGDAGRGTQ